MVIESFSDIVAVVVIVLGCVVPISHFEKVLSDVVVKALDVGIGVEVLANVNANLLTAVMTALEFPMPIRWAEVSC